MEASIKERSYRTVNLLRHQNQREQRRLDEKINSKQGLRANCNTELNAVSKEQQRIKQELVKIRKTITTTWGILPPRGAAQEGTNPVHQRHVQLADLLQHNKKRPGKGAPERQRINRPDRQAPTEDFWEEGDAEDDRTPPGSGLPQTIIQNEEEKVNESSENTPRANSNTSSISSINVEEAKENVARRLASMEHGTEQSEQEKKNDKALLKPVMPREQGNQPRFLTPIDEQAPEETVIETVVVPEPSPKKAPKANAGKKKQKVSTKNIEEAEKEFDHNKYNPDGSLRTVHKMQDFDARFTEAKKARYIRHKGNVPSDKELTVNEIFSKSKRH